MNSNEIEAKLEKDNQTIKTQIENLQNTIKKLKQDMFNNNDSKINLSTSNINSSNVSMTSLVNNNNLNKNIIEPQMNPKIENNNINMNNNKNLGMKFSFNSYMFEQNQNYDSKAFDEKLSQMVKKNNNENSIDENNNNNIFNSKEDNYDNNEGKINFIRSGCFYNSNGDNL